MRIENLRDHPELVPEVAHWQHELFSYLNPQTTLEERVSRIRAGLSTDLHENALPVTLIAMSDEGHLQGAASLVASTITHKHLTPWLSSVLTVPAYRNRGVASALTKRLITEAEQLHYTQLYLFTPHNESLYASLGWQAMESVDLGPVSAVLMSRVIGSV